MDVCAQKGRYFTLAFSAISQAIFAFSLTVTSVSAEDLNAQKELLSKEVDQIGITIGGNQNAETLIIKPTSENPNYKVMKLESPNRLVIDLPNYKIAGSKTVKATSSSFVSAVRLGSHDANSRVVVDLKDNQDIETQVQKEGNNIIVSLGNPGMASPNVNKLNQTTESKVAANLNTDTDSNALIEEDFSVKNTKNKITEKTIQEKDLVVDNSIKKTEPVIPQTDKLKEEWNTSVAKLPETESSPKLTKLQIENGAAKEKNTVVASLTNPAKFTMQKTAPSEYVVRLSNSAMDKDSVSTVLAQNSQGLIRSVRPITEGKDVLLRIFAKPEASLEVMPEGNKIIISSALGDSNLPTALKNARAQAATEKLVEEKAPLTEPAKTTEVAKPVTPPPANNTGKPVEIKGNKDDLAEILGSDKKYAGRLISLDLQDTDIDNALRIIAEVSNLNIIASDDVTGKVTLRLIDVPWDQALDVILKTNNLDKVQEGNVVRIAPVDKLRAEREALKQARQAEDDLEDLQTRYFRISYAKAAEVKGIVDKVLTERGQATYDERSNQIIVKDIAKGVQDAASVISKLDLRTPQVLLETQIVEASRTLVRDLGSQFGFRYIQSPETGNATGDNFPNAVDLGGSFANPAGSLSNAVSVLFESADGTKTISSTISALESEGRIRVVSRPAVATTNNKQATIRSVRKIRIRLPSGGVSVATGQGATAAGQGNSATETIEVGIVLEVTPQASPDYYVLLDVNAKSSTLGEIIGSDGIPSEIERSATSSVLVSSGQTFALGGIYKITDNDNVNGLPFFKDIPFIGHLFRRAQINNGDEELLFFLTPRIVEGSFDDATMKQNT